MPTATPSAHHHAAATARRLGRVLVLSAVLSLAALATAPAASAIDDPRRPDARVTHGPSCRPGGVVVEVGAGTDAYVVVLSTTRMPDGEDGGEVAPDGALTLRTDDVAWGETIDPWLEYTAADGSSSYVDDLDGYTFTRPAEEDCAAITLPESAATVPTFEPGSAGGPYASEPPGTLPAALPAAELPANGLPANGLPATGEVPTGTVVATEPVALSRPAATVPLLAAATALGAAVSGLVVVAYRRWTVPAGPPAGSYWR